MLDGKNFRACYDTLTQKIDMCCNRFYSKKLLKHRMVSCNKDISIYLEGFEVPYIMDYLSRRILLKADTKFLFRESGRSSRQKAIREHFASKGTLESQDSEDIHEFCSLYKRWMRTLAEPLIPMSTQNSLIKRLLLIGPEPNACHLHGMAELLVGDGLTQSLVCLIHCIFFLQQIVSLHKENGMNADALAGIFAVIFFDVEANLKADSGSLALFEVIISGLIVFLEYLFSGGANSVLQAALASSDLNKKRVSTDRTQHTQFVRSHSVSNTPRSRHVLMDNEPVLLEWRTADFDEAVHDGTHLLS